jgi:hypothetical protein
VLLELLTENTAPKYNSIKHLDSNDIVAGGRKTYLARTKKEGDECKIQLSTFLQGTKNGVMITVVQSQLHDELIAGLCNSDTKPSHY